MTSCLRDLGRKGQAARETVKFARVAGSQPVCVPAHSTSYVHALGGKDGVTAILEPLTLDPVAETTDPTWHVTTRTSLGH